jgi:gas vesicle protein
MVRDSTGKFRNDRAHRQAPAQSSSHLGAGIASVLGAAAVGAVAMYLMDPHHGAQRRAKAIELAGRALDTSSGAARGAIAGVSQFAGLAGDAIGSARDKVGAAASAAYEAAPNGKDLIDAGQQFASNACDTASGLRDRAGGWLDSARQWIPWRQRKQPPAHAVGPVVATSAAVGTLVIGAAAMWLFDPDRGRARRAWIGQRTSRAMREIGDFSSATGRHLRDRVKGYYYGTRRKIRGGGMPADEAESVSHA